MRFAFVVSSGLGYQIPNLFQNEESFLAFQEALQALRRHGFTGVELNLHSDDQHLLARIRGSVNEAGLRLAALGTGLLYAEDKLSFTDSDSAKREKAIRVVKRLLQFAAGDRAVAVIGLVRGVPNVQVGANKLLREALIECDRAAAECGGHIGLEAINRYETPLLNTASDVVKLIEDERLTATGLLLDTFHMNIEEASIEETIRKYVSLIAHFHIADSNRWPPSHGHLKLDQHLRLLQELGYEGWVSAELLPKPDNATAVAETAQFLRVHKFI